MSISTEKQMNLKQAIETRTVRAGVIGLGYVGLPLATEFARVGVSVVGIDLDEEKVNQIRQGISYIQDVPDTTVRKLVEEKKLHATTDFSVIRDLDTVNICVPTPLRKSKDPDISFIVSATKEIARYLHKNMLIILESTTYPGTTEEVILPMLEETGLKVGTDFYLAFSPERVDPGNPTYHTRNIPKVVGGVTPACTELAKAFYALAIDEVHTVSSPKSAEMVKLLENTFRSVNIGLVNELCLMSEKLGLDVWEIIDAAATKPFGFMPFYPGPGLGGHCIPIDPHYLAWKARVNGFNPRFIELASDVNKMMPEFVVKKAQSFLNQKRKALNGANILILGLAYKKNVSDVRESPSLEIIELLERDGAHVSYFDPFVPSLTLGGKKRQSIDSDVADDVALASRLSQCDLAILVSNHDCFDYELILDHVPALLDTRNATRKFTRHQGKILRI